MALIKCPECGKDVSDKAEICVNCGYPISKYIVENQTVEKEEPIKEESEEIKEEVMECAEEPVEEQNKIHCPVCGFEGKSNDDYCPECGFRLTPYNIYQEIDEIAKSQITPLVPSPDNSNKQISKKNTMGILSLVFGIVGILSGCITIGIMPSVVGLAIGIASISGKNKNTNVHKNINIAGIICSSIGTILSIIVIIVALATSPDTVDSSVKTETAVVESETVVVPSEEPTIEPTDTPVPTVVPTQTPSPTPKPATTPTPKPTGEPRDEFLQSLENNMDSSLANEVYDILKNQIGFTTLSFDSKVDGSENYVVYMDGSQGCVTAMDGYIRVFIPNSDYVFYEDGKVTMTASDFSGTQMSQDEMIAYYIMAQDAVEASLKNPSSAKFPSIITHASEIGMKKNGDIVAVQSYVDAKNSLNAKVRSKWRVQFQVNDIDSYSYTLLYINIDGESSGTFIDMD